MVFDPSGICIRVDDADTDALCFQSFIPFSCEASAIDVELRLCPAPFTAPVPLNCYGQAQIGSVGKRFFYVGTDDVALCTESAALPLTERWTLYLRQKDEPKAALQAQLLLRLAFESLFAKRGGVSPHAGCLTRNGEALLFMAPSHGGKSSLMERWRRGAPAWTVLNADRPSLSLHNGKVSVSGAPWSGVENVYRSETARPLALIDLRHGRENRLRRLSAQDAYAALLARCSLPVWDAEAAAAAAKTVRLLAEALPLYRMDCVNEQSAADALMNALAEDDILPLQWTAAAQVQRLLPTERDMQRGSGYSQKEIDGSLYALPVHGGEALRLDGCAPFLWERLSRPQTKTELLNALLAEYAVERDEAAADLDAFLTKLKAFDALEDVR